MNLLLTLPYCSKDADLLIKCLGWMKELHNSYSQPCLLVADSGVDTATKKKIHAMASGLFSFCETMIVRISEDNQKWPVAPNLMFNAAARQIQESFKMPWLWFEPDMVPVKRRWLDVIGQAYGKCPKRFMGSHIPADGQPNVPPVHLAGCAVYDATAYSGMSQFAGKEKAFDIASADYAVPRSINFDGMQHYWGSNDLAPTFKDKRLEDDPKNVLTLDFIKPDSVTFHRCKDGSLIDVLRQKLLIQPVKKNVPAQTPELVTP